MGDQSRRQHDFDHRRRVVVATLDSKSVPIRAKFTDDGRYVLASNAQSGDVAVFDARLTAGKEPDGLGYSPLML